MFFDTLESRCLMSSTVITTPIYGLRPPDRLNLTLAFDPTVLNVVGTNGNDQIRVTRTPTHLVVNVNGRGTLTPLSQVRSLRILGLGGHDRIMLVDPAGRPAFVDGGAGNDFIFGGPANDTLVGGDGADWIQGNNGNDVIDGGLGNDLLEGGAGNDTLIGGAGRDRMFGQTGNDFFYANDREFDYVDGGLGIDRASVDQTPFADGRNSIESIV